MKNISPLRYPGGKTRACKILNKILSEHFDMTKYTKLYSPFFGGGSFEFFIMNTYNYEIIANDKFNPLYIFWKLCKTQNKDLCDKLYNCENITKEQFIKYRNEIMNINDELTKAYYYFIINRCSFSEATLSGGFSLESSKKRFTKSSIDRISKLQLDKLSISNLDFSDFLKKNIDGIIFLDPPYYLDKKSKLYGKNGDMHENFNHMELFNIISKKKNWIMTYNNCDYIKNLYKNFIIIECNWKYGMNKTKQSSEIVIVSKDSLIIN